MVDMEGMNAGWGHCIYRPPTWIDNLPWTIRIVVSFAHVHPWTYRCCLLPRVSVFRRQPTALLGHNATTHHESVESQNGSYAQPKCGNTTSPRRRPIQNIHTHPFRHLPSSHQTDPGSGTPNETQTQMLSCRQRPAINGPPSLACPSACRVTRPHTHHRARACVHPANRLCLGRHAHVWLDGEGRGAETRRYLRACLAWLGRWGGWLAWYRALRVIWHRRGWGVVWLGRLCGLVLVLGLGV